MQFNEPKRTLPDRSKKTY